MPILDTSCYKGADGYSDGPIEDEMLAMVSAGPVTPEILARDNRWPLLCHFAPERRNLLEWFPFNPAGRLMEVGAGCGALTGLFCDKLSEVQAVELSLKRSRILEKRYADRANLRICVGNLLDLRPAGRFDYITLIGVLEYAAAFIPDSRPHLALLRRLADQLQPGGVLLLAIENKFGLKYFAGAPEDHTGRLFDGIEGYPHGGPARTFARGELDELLAQAGFGRRDFYYPHPDYKLPREIFSDAWLPQPHQVLTDAPNYDHERLRMLSETRAWENIIRAGYFKLFANSFLVAASRPETRSGAD